MDHREQHLADPFRPSRRPFGCCHIQEAGSRKYSNPGFLPAAQQLLVAPHVLTAAFVSALLRLTIFLKPVFLQTGLRKLFIVLLVFFALVQSRPEVEMVARCVHHTTEIHWRILHPLFTSRNFDTLYLQPAADTQQCKWGLVLFNGRGAKYQLDSWRALTTPPSKITNNNLLISVEMWL